MQNYKRSSRMRNKSGFTILEVLVVIVMLSVMMGIGFNYITGWLPNFRARSAARDVFSNLQSARMAAIKTHKRCTVTFRDSGTNDGYDIYIDANGNFQYDNGEDSCSPNLLKNSINLSEYKGDAIFNGVTLPDNSVTFLPNGLIDNTQGTSSRKVTIQTKDGGLQWEIEVTAAGGVSIQQK